MKGAAISLALILVSFGPAPSRDISCQFNPDESNLALHGCYTNVNGDWVHLPAKSIDGRVPTEATARCRDGDYSSADITKGPAQTMAASSSGCVRQKFTEQKPRNAMPGFDNLES
jgi:Protein of unknown function (DUF3761)